MRVDELDRLANLRTLLNDSAELLHLPQDLLGRRSVREVHEQLAQLHAVPSIGGAPKPDSITGDAVLNEYQSLSEVFHRLSERWHVSAEDFVWRGYEGERFTADDHGCVRLGDPPRSLGSRERSLQAVAARTAAVLNTPAPLSRSVMRSSSSRLAAICSRLPRLKLIGLICTHPRFVTL